MSLLRSALLLIVVASSAQAKLVNACMYFGSAPFSSAPFRQSQPLISRRKGAKSKMPTQNHRASSSHSGPTRITTSPIPLYYLMGFLGKLSRIEKELF